MRFIIAAVTVAALIAFLQIPWLRKHPSPLYAFAIAVDLLYAYGVITGATGGLWYHFMPLMQRCAIAFILFTIVMFVGVFDERSKIRSTFMPIRRQMSILACIFCCCHIIFYGASYLPRLTDAFATSSLVAIIIGVALSAILIPLLITSLLPVKGKMHASTWKKVQKLAYPFYLFAIVHLALLLTPSAVAGNETAAIGIAIYLVIGVAYVALRLRRHFIDARG